MARLPNISLGSGRQLALSWRAPRQAPFFVLPSLYWLPKRDVSFTLMSAGLGVSWGRWSFQAQVIWRAERPFSPPLDAPRAQELSRRIRELFGQSVDPVALRQAFSRQKPLRALHAFGVESTPCGLRVAMDAAAEEQAMLEQLAAKAAERPRVGRKGLDAPAADTETGVFATLEALTEGAQEHWSEPQDDAGKKSAGAAGSSGKRGSTRSA
jgi:hypothetical protein